MLVLMIGVTVDDSGYVEDEYYQVRLIVVVKTDG